jgi:hypothetical protein
MKIMLAVFLIFLIFLLFVVLFYEDDKIELKLMKDITQGLCTCRLRAAQNTYATEQILDIALDDDDSSVKLTAINNRNITTKLIVKALNDVNREVSLAASKHPKCPKDLRLIYILSN